MKPKEKSTKDTKRPAMSAYPAIEGMLRIQIKIITQDIY